jgi:hypothetical protein
LQQLQDTVEEQAAIPSCEHIPQINEVPSSTAEATTGMFESAQSLKQV